SFVTQPIIVTPLPDAPQAQNLIIAGPANQLTPIFLAGSDVDGDSLTYVFTSPAHGTLSGTGPALVYHPNLDFIGTDSFTYMAVDGLFKSNEATVSITIKNGVSIRDGAAPEGDKGTSKAVCTVRLTAPIREQVSI